MKVNNQFDVIIIGGSYSGLAASMALGRALRKVLIIDSAMPCNRQTPHSHNFLTQDGSTPQAIATSARKQVQHYKTVHFFDGLATKGNKTESGFEIETSNGETFQSTKLVIATGIKDIMLPIEGYAECWGISVLHCPYCHGYEVRNEITGILGNGEYGYEFSALISNWTSDLTLYTNGKSTLTKNQIDKLVKRHIQVVEDEIFKLEHENGYLQNILFKNGNSLPIKALYARSPFVQHSDITQSLGCELTEDGYIKVNSEQKTTVHGIFASGDNTTRLRTVANAVAMGTTAGMMANKELIEEYFLSL